MPAKLPPPGRRYTLAGCYGIAQHSDRIEPSAVPLLSVVVLTRDEQTHLSRCLDSLASLDARIFVVDCGSTDATVDIAHAAGCQVVHRDWRGYAEQFNWALDHLPIESPWVMRLDADEHLTPELAQELRATLRDCDPQVSGLLIKRRVYFWGRWIRHGGYYPTWLLRVWRAGQVRYEARSMDEHALLGHGHLLRLRNDFIDENLKGLGHWIDKHNRYADLEVEDLLTPAPRLALPSGPAGRRRWWKTTIYARSPLFLRAVLYWLYRYFLRLGVLDGKAGLAFHFLQALWYRWLVDAKLVEARARRPQP